MRSSSSVLAGLVASVLAAGCGGGASPGTGGMGGGNDPGAGGAGGTSGGDSCPAFNPCGGELLGTWKIVSSCFSPLSASSSCSAETYGAIGFQETGTYTFNSDLTYGGGVTPTGGLTIDVPQSCLPGQPIATTCGVLNASYQPLVGQPGSPYSSAGCSLSGAADCLCAFAFNGQALALAGTYAKSGSTSVVLTRAGSTSAETDTYCVNGTTLYLGAPPAAGTSIVGELVLIKQQ